MGCHALLQGIFPTQGSNSCIGTWVLCHQHFLGSAVSPHAFSLWPSDIPLYIWTTSASAIHLPGGHLAGFHVLSLVNSAAVSVGVHAPFQSMALSGCVPRSRIAGSYGSVFSFLRNSTLFSTLAAPICIPTYRVGGLSFLLMLSSICYL